MYPQRSAVFLIQLVQDVNVLRPLVFMASRDFGIDPLLLVSTKFSARDAFGIWRNELNEICAQAGARLEFFEDNWEAHRHLRGEGLLFSASESHLHNHVTTHDVFRHAPPTYLKVTLQHGFECVGFRHGADHVRAHGSTASFGADIVCSWMPAERLYSLAPSQRAKLLVTGPTSVLQMPQGDRPRAAAARGLVCENLHSVRLNGPGDLKIQFVDAFNEFCRLMRQRRARVALRPHPGGQFALKNKLALPKNAEIENAPLYRLDLRQFAYGISAPSSVLIDMLLANVPTAVWRDAHGTMDAHNYNGLPSVSSPQEWVEFAREAEARPQRLIDEQQRFLARQDMILDPKEVYGRFAELFWAARRMELRRPGSVAERARILFVANDNIPTLQLSFDKPLAALVERGEITSRLLSEREVRGYPASTDPEGGTGWMDEYLDGYNPSIVIFCRYSGPGYRAIISWARRNSVPIMYHIDDDLLAVPADIGEKKAQLHNAPERREAVATLLQSADLVYSSTERLTPRLLRYFPNLQIATGGIYCAGSVLAKPSMRERVTVGYMASADHAHNLTAILPAIDELLDKNKHVDFEFFGSIPVPELLGRFGDRVSTAPPVANYGEFMRQFCERRWDIGICPLAPIEFNMMKADTKWVEYSSVGAAVVASRGTVYDQCCADGCGILAEGTDEWFSALQFLVNNPQERIAIVERAQAKLRGVYSLSSLRHQVLGMIDLARRNALASSSKQTEGLDVCHTL